MEGNKSRVFVLAQNCIKQTYPPFDVATDILSQTDIHNVTNRRDFTLTRVGDLWVTTTPNGKEVKFPIDSTIMQIVSVLEQRSGRNNLIIVSE